MFMKSQGFVSLAIELMDTEEENSDEPADAEVTLSHKHYLINKWLNSCKINVATYITCFFFLPNT